MGDSQRGDGGGQKGTAMRRRRRRGAAEKVLDVGRRQRALGQHGLASLFDKRRDVVQLVFVGAFLSTPALDVVFDVVKTLHHLVDDPAHDHTTLTVTYPIGVALTTGQTYNKDRKFQPGRTWVIFEAMFFQAIVVF